MKNLHIEHDGQTVAVITVLLGVSLFPGQGDDSESALESADAALYRTMENGRSQVVTADLGAATRSQIPNENPVSASPGGFG